MQAEIGHNSAGRTRCIFRAHGDRGYTKLRNAFLQDKRISDETRGLIARLLSLPEDWEVTVQGIIASGKAGRDKVYRMLREAEEFGYVKPEERSRSEKGKFDRQLYLVSDDPAALIEQAAEELLQMEERRNIDIPVGKDGRTYVYVLQRGDQVKVGISVQPKQRIYNINATSGEPPAEACFFYASTQWEAAFIERGVHWKLSRKHVENEWFRCSPEEAIEAVKLVASHPFTDFPDVAEVLENKGSDPCEAKPYTGEPCPASPRPANQPQQSNIDTKGISNKDMCSASLHDADRSRKPKSKKAPPEAYSKDFDAFWEIYPWKKGKGVASTSWERLSLAQKRKAYVSLKAQLPELTARKQDARGNFCPMPATWINQGRFDDEIDYTPRAEARRPIRKTKEEMTLSELEAYYEAGGV